MPDSAKQVGQHVPSEALTSQKSNTFQQLYANSAQLEVTPWDFNLIFGEVMHAAGVDPFIEQHVKVIMSPQHAKALLAVLANNVELYEKQVGVIPIPQPVQSSEQTKTAPTKTH